MKIAIALAGALLLSVVPAIAEDAAPSTTTAAPAAAPAASAATQTPAAAPAAAPANSAPATVDQSKLSPNMQSFMSKVDALRARRQSREGESTSRVLPAGDPVSSKAWHKSQGHKRVNWSGASGHGRRHHHKKKKSAEGETKGEEKAEKTVEKKESKKAEKKAEAKPKAEKKKKGK